MAVGQEPIKPSPVNEMISPFSFTVIVACFQPFSSLITSDGISAAVFPL